jgi:hypothetical protein
MAGEGARSAAQVTNLRGTLHMTKQETTADSKESVAQRVADLMDQDNRH